MVGVVLPDNYSWSVKEGKKETFLPMSIVELLEDAFTKKKAKFVRQGVTYDLKNLVTKQKGQDDLELKRVTCSGKAYDAKNKSVGGLKPAGAAADANGQKADTADTKDAPAKKGSKRKNNAGDGECISLRPGSPKINQ